LVAVIVRRDLPAVLCGFGLAWSGSCAVFPDEAILPGTGASAGMSGLAGGGAGGTQPAVGGAHEPPPGGAAHAGEGPTLPTAGAGGAPGDAGAPSLGGAGSPGAAGSSCDEPSEELVRLDKDTWIEAAKPAAGHGNDVVLSVVGGGSERRALLELSLPEVPPGASLRSASLELVLTANANTASERRLAVHRLLNEFHETRTDWQQFDNGVENDWENEGGDFGPELAQTAIPASLSSGLVRFELTAAVRVLQAAQVSTVALIALEVGPPPSAPADLAFVSREGDASSEPVLRLSYCAQ
jgi:hypothetical protein